MQGFPGRRLAVVVAMALVAATSASAQQVLILEKSTNGVDADSPPGPVVLTGSTVTWTYLVTNGSGRDVTAISVTDDQGVIVSCPQATLGAGESMTCTASGTAQSGQYANLGTATGLQGGEPVSATDPSHYFGQTAEGVTLEKSTNGFDADAAPGPAVPVGSAVSWEYLVTNVGADPLSNVEVTDDHGVVVSCPQTTLAPAESMTCTASGTAQVGQYANLGTVTAVLPSEDTVAASDPSHYFGQTLLLEKSTNGVDADFPPGPKILVGDAVDWTYEVSNPGPASVTGVAVSDDQVGAVSCPQTTLAAGESMTCTASGTAMAGQYANLGTATATLSGGGEVTASDPSHYFGTTLSLEKATNGEDADAPPGPTVLAGGTVDWTYVVSNLGPDPLTGVTVTDDQGVVVTCPATDLAAGASMTCTASGTAQSGPYANLGTVTALAPGDVEETDSDPSHYFGNPLTLEKSTNGEDADTAPGPTVTVGDTVTWDYVVTNFGTDPVDNVTVTDDQGVAVSCPATTLAGGTAMTCTGSGPATEGQYANLGTTTAELAGGLTVSATDPSHYLGEAPAPPPSPIEVPTLPPGALALLGLLLAVAALWALGRRAA